MMYAMQFFVLKKILLSKHHSDRRKCVNKKNVDWIMKGKNIAIGQLKSKNGVSTMDTVLHIDYFHVDTQP